MSGHYLSIDVDYFLSYESVGYYLDTSPVWDLCKFLSRVKHIENKVFVEDHDKILPHINASCPEKIIHVDFHQDIVFPSGSYSKEKIELTEGTFLYFVDNKKDIDFIWYYPSSDLRLEGLCMGIDTKPFSRKNHIFRTQRCKSGLPSKKALSNVTAVGVSLSPSYLTHNLSDIGVEKLIRILSRKLKTKYVPQSDN